MSKIGLIALTTKYAYENWLHNGTVKATNGGANPLHFKH